MNRVCFLIIASLVVCATGCASSGGHPAQPPESEYSAPVVEMATQASAELPVLLPQAETPPVLRTIAYNAHLLPSVALPIAGKRSGGDYRAEKIGEQVASYDLIGLTEVFDATYRESLIDQVQSQAEQEFHVALGPERSGRHMVGGGLLLLSKYPILETHTVTYQNATWFFTHGFRADGFAAKGALHVRILVDEQTGSAVDCFLTHLDSRSANVRREQLQEFCTFIAEYQQKENPVLLLGDFNIAATEPTSYNTEYDNLLAQIDRLRVQRFVDVGSSLSGGPTGSSDALASGGGRRIDYIFAANPVATQGLRLVPQAARHLPFRDEQVPEGSLSDHLAVACEFALTR
ncbi:hypothetical protein DTL42_13600 [Bremerella cremea]|uniref:Endonuclease/exonuclease/phosphatase domain-containing protein n=1 Tax=Bremerella cremea TaxID=1031537 RepID=A0A368KQF8_9BACT|nr:sphingomyelin phosphodiesterase [Bremerella cremea]RCS48235.1 hypothetical protein DTL42_13600 [Bremerella cremea]